MFIVISGQQGAGKTLVSDILIAQKRVSRVVTDTSRSPRRKSGGRYEVHGKDYYFVAEDRFTCPLTRGDYIEHTVRVDENGKKVYYGTHKGSIAEAKKHGAVRLLVIDPSGLVKIKDLYGEDVLTVVLAASEEELKKRLTSRPGWGPRHVDAALLQGKEDVRYLMQNIGHIGLWIENRDGGINDVIKKITTAIDGCARS